MFRSYFLIVSTLISVYIAVSVDGLRPLSVQTTRSKPDDVDALADSHLQSSRDSSTSHRRSLQAINSWYNFCYTYNGPVCPTCQLQPSGSDPCVVRLLHIRLASVCTVGMHA